MATTPAEVCNIALGRIGHRQFIDSLSEDTAEAEACAVAYPHARDVLLESFPWRFATRRATLALLADQTREGWAYVYALPSDFVAAQRLYNEANLGPLLTATGRTAYAVEGAAQGRVLLTDQASAILIYTARVESLAVYPALAQDALAWLLAAELANSLAVKPQLAVSCLQQYERTAARAMAAELRQEQDTPPGESEFIRVRY